MARTRRGNSNEIKVDLSKVESGFTTIEEGIYTLSVDETSMETTRDGNPYIKFVFKVEGPSFKGQTIWHNCSLQPQALFNLKAVLESLGFEIPNKAFELDIEELIGLECQAEVGHEVYQGKTKARIVEFISQGAAASEADEGNIEDELEEMDEEALVDLAVELGVTTIRKSAKLSKDDLLDLIFELEDEEILEALDKLDEAEDDEDEEEEETDYEDMTLGELKVEARERGLKVLRRMTKDDLIEMLEEDDEE